MTGLEVLPKQQVKTKVELWAPPGAQMVKNLPAVLETWSDPWVGQISWRREQQPTPVFLPGESHGQWSLEGYSPRVAESRTRLSDPHKGEV